MDRVQKARFRFAVMGHLRQIENAFFLNQFKFLKDPDWSGVPGDLEAFFSQPGMRAAWTLIGDRSGNGLRAQVRTIVDRHAART